MHKITEGLKTNGFSINSLCTVINSNNGKRSFNTLDYFCIHIIMQDIEITIDNRKYIIEHGNIAYIGPGKEITYGEKNIEENAVYLLVFSNTFYEKSAKDSLILNSELFFNSDALTVISPPSTCNDQIKKLIIDRFALYQEKKNEGLYIAMAHNCIEALILDGLLYIEEKKGTTLNVKSQNFMTINIINKFRVLLQKHHKQEKNVSFYANLLNITPRKLTEMSEIILGKTAKQFIIDKVVTESVRLILYSNLSITGVAYEVGFKEEGNFSIFIKKNTGKSPSDWRNTIKNN